MTMQETISKLEALLSRIRTRASEARPVVVAHAAALEPAAEMAPAAPHVAAEPEPVHVPFPTAPPPAEAAAVLESTRGPVPEVVPALESRARLVAEREVEPEVLELDERHVVRDSSEAEAEVSIVAEDIIVGEEEVRDTPPPSSRRPIAEPLDAAPPEAAPTHTPPPESGRQVAALSFDDDFTGVRDAAQRPAPPPDPDAPEIHLASQHPPAIVARHEMEAELDAPHSAMPASRPPASVRLPSERPIAALDMEPEVIRPVLAPAAVADVQGALTFAPKSFGELLDASLAL